MYLAAKVIHILAVVAFLGNISTGIFWKTIADRSGRREVIAHTLRGIILSDRIITVPAIIVIIAAGFATAGIGNFGILSTGWILWALVLFIIAGLAFIPISRAQRELATIAETTASPNVTQDGTYQKFSGQWQFYGLIGLLAPIASLVLMVVKPALPAFHHS